MTRNWKRKERSPDETPDNLEEQQTTVCEYRVPDLGLGLEASVGRACPLRVVTIINPSTMMIELQVEIQRVVSISLGELDTAQRRTYGGILVRQLSVPGLEGRDGPEVGFSGRGRGGLFARAVIVIQMKDDFKTRYRKRG